MVERLFVSSNTILFITHNKSWFHYSTLTSNSATATFQILSKHFCIIRFVKPYIVNNSVTRFICAPKTTLKVVLSTTTPIVSSSANHPRNYHKHPPLYIPNC